MCFYFYFCWSCLLQLITLHKNYAYSEYCFRMSTGLTVPIYIFAHKIHVCQSRRPEVLAYIFDILIVVSHCCPKQQFTSKPKKFWQPSGHRNAVGVYLQIHLHINLFIASSFHEIILQNVACWSHFSPYSNSSIFRLISPIAHNFLAEIQNELYFSFEFPFFFFLFCGLEWYSVCQTIFNVHIARWKIHSLQS